MKTARSRLAVLLVAVVAPLGLTASPAAAATDAEPAPVAGPLSADPAGGVVRGTMIMIHAGGWAGHDAHAQGLLMDRPGTQLVQRGWRVVSVDYNEGTAGLQDVLDAAGAELARGSGNGPLCLYGESAGAHLALVAASRLRAIDCVIGLGAPTDLMLYQTDAAAGNDMEQRLVAYQMRRFFGDTPSAIAPWDLVALAPSIHADVLLFHEDDDTVVPAVHDARFQAARPTTQLVNLEAGDEADPSTQFVHGNVSAAGQAQYAAEVNAFAERAIVDRDAEREAARTGCSRVNRSVAEVGASGIRAALRCLATKDPSSLASGVGSWKRISFVLRGETNAARVWTKLRSTASGRHALAALAKRRAKVTVRKSTATRILVRR